MTSIYSINAENSRRLVDGIYSCFIRQNQIVITDGTNEWIIGEDDFSPTLSLYQFPYVDSSGNQAAIVSQSNTLINCLNALGGQVCLLIENGKTYLTKQVIMNDSEIQEELRGPAGRNGTNGRNGKSAFELWADNQPVRYEQDGTTVIPYTYQEYEAAMKGPKGDKGAKGDKGDKGEDASSSSFLDWLNLAFNAGELGALGASIATVESQLSTLQGQVLALQGQMAAIRGTDAVTNTIDNITDAAGEMSDFSDVATEGRSLFDGLDDWFDGMRQRVTHQTNSYTQLTNNYTPAELSSVSNADLLVDVQGLLTL